MTYKQIEQIEKFIHEVKELNEKRTTLTPQQWLASAMTMNEKLLVSGIGYNNTMDWEKCSYFMYEDGTKYFPEEIASNIAVMLSALQGILDAIPQYPYILEVRKDIARGRKIKKANKHNFIAEIVVKYQGKIDFGKVIQDYLKEDNMLSWSIEDASYFNGLIQKLELYLSEICEEKKVVKPQSQPKPNIVIQQNQNVSQEANINIAVSFEDCFKALDDCETLDDVETQEIKAQLEEIQELLKDKRGKKKTIKQKIGSILKWVGDKGTDVMIAILPIVLQNLQGLQ